MFTVAKTNKHLTRHLWGLRDPIRKVVWLLHGPQRLWQFPWLVVKGTLLTDVEGMFGLQRFTEPPTTVLAAIEPKLLIYYKYNNIEKIYYGLNHTKKL